MGTGLVFHKVVLILTLFLLLFEHTSCNTGNAGELRKRKSQKARLGFPLSIHKHKKHTDIDFDLELPVPQVPIKYPTYTFGFKFDDLFPIKVIVSPFHLIVDIAKQLLKVLDFVWELLCAVLRIIGNALGIVKLWGLFHALHKAKLHHPGWSPEDDLYENPDHWK